MRSATTIGLLLLAVGTAMAADVLVPVYVDGQKQSFNGLMRDGRTYVPLRAGAKAIGADTRWDPTSRQAIVCVGDRCVPIKADQGINVNGHLLVPLRLMGEAIGCTVGWDKRTHAVVITRPAKPFR